MNIMNLRLLGVATAAALTLAGCATSGYGYNDRGYGNSSGYNPSPGYGSSTANCYDCGTVTRIEQISGGSSAPRATGAVLGGLVGAAAGRTLTSGKQGSGRRNTATVAGAVVGAVAGNAIQRNVGGARYNVHVRMQDGRTTVVTQDDLNGINEGSYVRVYNGRAWIR